LLLLIKQIVKTSYLGEVKNHYYQYRQRVKKPYRNKNFIVKLTVENQLVQLKLAI
jgi:hypothetical protein